MTTHVETGEQAAGREVIDAPLRRWERRVWRWALAFAALTLLVSEAIALLLI